MKENFLFLGFVLSDEQLNEVIKNDKFPQYQTYKFTKNLIKALEYKEKINVTYISAQPVSDYPYFFKKRFIYSEEEIDFWGKKIKIYNIPFYNTSLLKIITRTISSLFYGIKIFKNKKNKKGIIIYSVHIPYMLSGIILGKIFRVKVIGLWTDPPSISHHMESKLKKILRGIEFKLSKNLMLKMDKTITMTKYLSRDFCFDKPNLVIEGIIDLDEMNMKESKKTKTKTRFLYTGSLSIKYGIKNIVEAFFNIARKDIELEIYGVGDYVEELKEICKLDERIIYGGFISNEKIILKQRLADFLINARSNEDEYVKYSFPSKTLEYMLSGTPLISTYLLGMPEKYKEYFILLKDNKISTIKEILLKCLDLSIEERKKIGEKSKKFIESKDYKIQSEKIIKFLEG